jgi:hypothetical protein
VGSSTATGAGQAPAGTGAGGAVPGATTPGGGLKTLPQK